MRGAFPSHNFFKITVLGGCLLGGGVISPSYAQILPDQLNALAAIQDQRDQQIKAQQQAAIAAQAAAYHAKQVAAERATHARKAAALAAQKAKAKAKADALAAQEQAKEKEREGAIEKSKMEQAAQADYQEKLHQLEAELAEDALKNKAPLAPHSEASTNKEAEIGTTAETVSSTQQNTEKTSHISPKSVIHWWEFWRYWLP